MPAETSQNVAILRSLWRRAPWAVVAVFFIALVACYFISQNYYISYIDEHLTLTPKLEKPNRRGFYIDYNPPEGTQKDDFQKKEWYYATYEDIDITPKNGLIVGKSHGNVKKKGKDIHKSWSVTGHIVGEYLFMTYKTMTGEGDNDLSPSGIGNYALAAKADDYVGYIIFRDSTHDVTLKCPYVLSNELNLSVEGALKKYPQLQAICEPVIYRD
jgi:hypothetical protein